MGTTPSHSSPPLPILQNLDQNRSTSTNSATKQQSQSPQSPQSQHDSTKENKEADLQRAEAARIARTQAFGDAVRNYDLETERKAKEVIESARLAALRPFAEELQLNVLVGRIVEQVVDVLVDNSVNHAFVMHQAEQRRIAAEIERQRVETERLAAEHVAALKAAAKEEQKRVEATAEKERALARLAARAELIRLAAAQQERMDARIAARIAKQNRLDELAEIARKERVMAIKRAAAEQEAMDAEILRLKELEDDDVVFQGGETLDERLAKGAMSSIDLTLEDTPVKSKPTSSGNSLPAIDLTQDTPVKVAPPKVPTLFDPANPLAFVGTRIKVHWKLLRGLVKGKNRRDRTGIVDSYDESTRLHHIAFDGRTSISQNYSFEIRAPNILMQKQVSLHSRHTFSIVGLAETAPSHRVCFDPLDPECVVNLKLNIKWNGVANPLSTTYKVGHVSNYFPPNSLNNTISTFYIDYCHVLANGKEILHKKSIKGNFIAPNILELQGVRHTFQIIGLSKTRTTCIVIGGTLTAGNPVEIQSGSHAGKKGTFIHATTQRYRIDIDGVGRRSISKENAKSILRTTTTSNRYHI